MIDGKQIIEQFEQTLRDAEIAAGESASEVLALARSFAPRIEAAVARYAATGDRQHLESIQLLKEALILEAFRHSSKWVNDQRFAIAAALVGVVRGALLALA